MNNISLIGIDLAKNVFQLHGVDKQRKTIIKKRINRANLMNVIRNITLAKLQWKLVQAQIIGAGYLEIWVMKCY